MTGGDDITEAVTNPTDSVMFEGGYGLPAIYRTTVAGIPALWTDAPGPARCALMFGAGRAHEPLAAAGVSHLVEHLSLSSLDSPTYEYNGQVEPLRTVFSARGTESELHEFLCRVSQAVREVPCERLTLERNVLRTEAASRGIGPVQQILSTRFGATGLGLSGFEEFGLRWLQPSDIREWAAQSFCRANAVLVSSFPLGQDLDLALPEGTGFRWPISESSIATPAATQSDRSGVACGFVAPRGVAMTSLLSILRRRLMTRLRDELGISYQVQTLYQPLSLQQAHIFLAADCLPEQATSLCNAMIQVLRQVSESGATPEELAENAVGNERGFQSPEAPLALLNRVAHYVLRGEPPVTPDVLMRELAKVTPAQQASALRGALQTALWVVPRNAVVPPGFYQLARWSNDTVPGRVFRPASKGRTSIHPVKLAVGDEGVTYYHDEKQPVTVRYTRCAALLRWDDGQRQLIGNDGFRVPIVPTRWKQGTDVVPIIDSHVDRRTWVAMGAPPPVVQQPKKRAVRFTNSGLIVAAVLCLAIGSIMLAGFFSPVLAPSQISANGDATPTDPHVYLAVAIISYALAVVAAAALVRRRMRRWR